MGSSVNLMTPRARNGAAADRILRGWSSMTRTASAYSARPAQEPASISLLRIASTSSSERSANRLRRLADSLPEMSL